MPLPGIDIEVEVVHLSSNCLHVHIHPQDRMNIFGLESAVDSFKGLILSNQS